MLSQSRKPANSIFIEWSGMEGKNRCAGNMEWKMEGRLVEDRPDLRVTHMMSDLLSARSQMGLSLAFHIIFAVIGVSFPLMMTIAELQWLRTREPVYQVLAKRWAKGAAILFAIGAVSGTVLSFELGLLWPRFMERAGSGIGMPFSLEGFAFFTEAIFLGIYLYGWGKVPELVHLFSGVVVAIS